jgi:ATP-dependent Lon protease
MIIEKTNIPNVVENTIEESKLVLAENIIKNVYPLFDEVYNSKVSSIGKLNKELKEKKNSVLSKKNELEELLEIYQRQKKIAKLLDRIEKLITSGLIYDGTLNQETKILLKVINKLDSNQLDYHLRNTLQTINKRFSR